MTRQTLLSVQELRTALKNTECIIVDCRFVLDDPVAGLKAYLESHIPGAVNYPYSINLSPNGLFKPVEEVRHGLLRLAGSHHAQDVVHMCGSGVTACHNIFSAELAGLKGSKLYVGSWSEWIRDPSRPVDRITPESS
jgi:thiosulfate/3-mercaptopyruvate sulfurtransferase